MKWVNDNQNYTDIIKPPSSILANKVPIPFILNLRQITIYSLRFGDHKESTFKNLECLLKNRGYY